MEVKESVTPQQENAPRTCPFCAEDIRGSALKCHHCKEWLQPPPNTRDFFKFLSDLWKTTLWGQATIVSGILPLVGGTFLESFLLPPLEWSKFIAYFATILSIIVIFFLYLTYRQNEQKTIHKTAVWFLGLGIFFCLIYVLTMAMAVVQGEKGKCVRGFVLTLDAKQRIESGKIKSSSLKDLIDGFGIESADQIWRDHGIFQFVLASSLLLFSPLIAGGFLLFTLELFMAQSAKP